MRYQPMSWRLAALAGLFFLTTSLVLSFSEKVQKEILGFLAQALCT
jgi:hypothetical protein